MINWIGVFPALTTKFDKAEKLDLDLYYKNLVIQLEAGVNGIILGGTLGEASTVTENEKEHLVRDLVRLGWAFFWGERLFAPTTHAS